MRTRTSQQKLTMILNKAQAEELLEYMKCEMLTSNLFAVKKKLVDFVAQFAGVKSHIDSDEAMDNASKPHTVVYTIYKAAFPASKLLQGVVIENSSGNFEIDILDETERIAVEIHGPQHYENNHYFHRGKKHGYMMQRSHDRKKRAWCVQNNYTYLEIPSKILPMLDADGIKQMVCEAKNGPDE